MSAAPGQSTIIAEINRVREVIHGLKDEQANALTDAAYLGMSNQESKAFDARSEQIKELTEKLDHLKYSL